MSATCISCGMPMENAEDHAMSDPTKGYCIHCARDDGSMKSYEEALESMTAFMVVSQGLAERPAKKMVKEMMSRLPAWKDR